MSEETSKSQAEARKSNVVVEIKETDDGIELSLKGLSALRGLKETLSPLCCCMPVVVSRKAADTPNAKE